MEFIYADYGYFTLTPFKCDSFELRIVASRFQSNYICIEVRTLHCKYAASQPYCFFKQQTIKRDLNKTVLKLLISKAKKITYFICSRNYIPFRFVRSALRALGKW